MISNLVSPHVGKTVLHSLATPQKVKHPQIFEHCICCEYLRKKELTLGASLHVTCFTASKWALVEPLWLNTRTIVVKYNNHKATYHLIS